jgi:SAM-dependent methyltransferase
MSGGASGTEAYAEEAAVLLQRYETVSFADHHRSVAHLFPPPPARILDIGAGTGRDAAGFAALGHRVVAVEPTVEMRQGAIALHPSPIIDWVDDSLPDLAVLRARGETFDLVMMNAVWMHLDEAQRRRAMPNVASLLADRGAMIMSLRYGPVPPGRRMFRVSAAETAQLAMTEGLRPVLDLDAASSLTQPGVSWKRLAFVRGDPHAAV